MDHHDVLGGTQVREQPELSQLTGCQIHTKSLTREEKELGTSGLV